MSSIKTPFAIWNDNIIHISELKKEKKSFDCKYYCCSCNEMLIPRLGNKNIWHFAHKSKKCINSLETGLHLMAKRILTEKKLIKLPNLYIDDDGEEREDFIYQSDISNIEPEYNYIFVCKSNLYSFESVKEESRINDIVPDIILYKNNKPLLVEIAVTHFIDDEKKNKIKDMKLSTIEIDLSEYNKNFLNMSIEEIEKIIIKDTKNKKWIYNDKAEKKILSIIESNKLYKTRKKEFVKKEKERLHLRKEFLYKNEALLKIKYKKDKEQSLLWKYLVKKLWINENDIPSVINVDIDDKLIFACDKNIWQSAILNQFVINKKYWYLSARKISQWIQSSSKIPLNTEIDKTYLENVISEYLHFLCLYDIISFEISSYRVNLDSFRAIVNQVNCKSK